MYLVTVAGGENRKLPAYLRSCLRLACRTGSLEAALCRSARRADLLILPRGASVSRSSAQHPASMLLLAGGQQPPPGQRVLRCGLCAGDELTLSSLREGRAMLSLTAFVRRLDGQLLEPQDISVELGEQPEPEALLAAAGALLLLGADGAAGLRLL